MNGLRAAAGVAGFLAVALGAFGAHGLEDTLSAEALGWWETATLYALVHAVAALATADARRPGRAGWLFLAGVGLFSGSLYALALTSLNGAPVRALGAITPLGGGLFLAGWLWIVIASVRAASRSTD